MPNGYRRLSGRARWATNVLTVLVLVDLLAVLVGAQVRSALVEPTVTQAEVDALLDRRSLVGVVQGGLTLVAAVVFIRVLARVSQPPSARCDGPAVSDWLGRRRLVRPVLNLVRPKGIANDIWRASEPGAEESWRQGRAPLFLGFWWAAFLVAGVVDGVARVTALKYV